MFRSAHCIRLQRTKQHMSWLAVCVSGVRGWVIDPVSRRAGAARRAEFALSGKSCIVSICCANPGDRMTHMVDIAQSVEQLIVVQQVARSSRVIHPSKAPLRRGLCHSTIRVWSRHAGQGAVRCAGILDICVCRRHALCDRRGRAGHPRVRGNARSNAAAGGQGAIGPVDWAVFPIQGKCGRSVAAPQMKNNQRIGEFSCLRLNSSSVRDVRPSRRSRRLWP